MTVTYLDPVYGWFAQYTRANAGYYPSVSRRKRREEEIAAHAAGVVQMPRLLGERIGAPCGAPGLLGGAPDAETLRARREAAYPTVGQLP